MPQKQQRKLKSNKIFKRGKIRRIAHNYETDKKDYFTLVCSLQGDLSIPIEMINKLAGEVRSINDWEPFIDGGIVCL